MKYCKECGIKVSDDPDDDEKYCCEYEDELYCEDCYYDNFSTCCVCYNTYPREKLNYYPWAKDLVCTYCVYDLSTEGVDMSDRFFDQFILFMNYYEFLLQIEDIMGEDIHSEEFITNVELTFDIYDRLSENISKSKDQFFDNLKPLFSLAKNSKVSKKFYIEYIKEKKAFNLDEAAVALSALHNPYEVPSSNGNYTIPYFYSISKDDLYENISPLVDILEKQYNKWRDKKGIHMIKTNSESLYSFLDKIYSEYDEYINTSKISRSLESVKKLFPEFYPNKISRINYSFIKSERFKKFIELLSILVSENSFLMDEIITAIKSLIEKLDKAIKYRIFNIKERKVKYEILSTIKYDNKALSYLITSPLIKQKIKDLRESKAKPKVEWKNCQLCNIENEESSLIFCDQCTNIMNSNERILFEEFARDVYERLLNYEFLINLFDTDLSNVKNLLIYEKKIDYHPQSEVFPKMINRLLIKALLSILQVTRIVQQISYPEVVTHHSIKRIHEIVHNTKDLMGREFNHPWGFHKFEETKFQEEFDKIILGSRTDIVLSYKDVSAMFDYQMYFQFQGRYKTNFNKPKISVVSHSAVIENKVTAFASKTEDGSYLYKIYLLDSKQIKLFNK